MQLEQKTQANKMTQCPSHANQVTQHTLMQNKKNISREAYSISDVTECVYLRSFDGLSK